MIKKINKYLFIVTSLIQMCISQTAVDSNMPSRLLYVYSNEYVTNRLKDNQPLKIRFRNSLYLNNNLPNLENINGLYIPKGYGNYSSISYNLNLKNLSISFEPVIFKRIEYNVNIPEKRKSFSALNDVPNNNFSQNNYRNTGIILKNNFLSTGYGNWNNWWGSGVHNSLILSNNSQGFFHYFIGTNKFKKVYKNLFFKYNYMVSEAMQNFSGDNYFFSAWYLNFKYKELEFGMASNTLSGGNGNLEWTFTDALLLFFTKKNNKYWDINRYLFIKSVIPESKLTLFIEIGFPKQNLNEHVLNYPYDHGMATNLGFRKKDIFRNEALLLGFEYTRLVQAVNYERIPSSNWYDNIKYNYSSFKGRRWGAHSGSDSDDFLVYIGYLDSKISLVYELNYERHGVTYHFPPEVKFERRISTSFFAKNFTFSIAYENEYYEHYGFVDSNSNVWDETFENGSVQKTKTILFSMDYKIF